MWSSLCWSLDGSGRQATPIHQWPHRSCIIRPGWCAPSPIRGMAKISIRSRICAKQRDFGPNWWNRPLLQIIDKKQCQHWRRGHFIHSQWKSMVRRWNSIRVRTHRGNRLGWLALDREPLGRRKTFLWPRSNRLWHKRPKVKHRWQSYTNIQSNTKRRNRQVWLQKIRQMGWLWASRSWWEWSDWGHGLEWLPLLFCDWPNQWTFLNSERLDFEDFAPVRVWASIITY